jgi:signal peptidase I
MTATTQPGGRRERTGRPAELRSGRPQGAPRDPRAFGRETVESIVVAFTLALLFRAFEAEAFVIPTGSMATTLMGRHKDLCCDACGQDYRVGCSAEEDEEAQRRRAELAAVEAAGGDPARIAALRRAVAAKLVPQARCPNCGRVMPLTEEVGGERRSKPDYPSFSGDRILVDKFAYDFVDPARWDVVVFKYPEDAKTNYIKRLVGLPGETVSIAAGDIWTARGDGAAAIARKPATTLRAMLQPVHDSAHVSQRLVQAGWPAAWADWSTGDGRAAGRWTTDDAGRSFAVACPDGAAATLRYRHLVPTPDDWQDLERGLSVADRAEPRFVGDFQPYNAESIGPHWVGDLAVELELRSQSAAGRLVLDLVEAGAVHRCTIDLADGRIEIVRANAAAGAAAVGRSSVRGRGSWTLLFANVDDELSLFVDGRRVTCDGETTWPSTLETAIAARPVAAGAQPGDREAGDLAPVGVTAEGCDVRLGRLRVLRDVYYIATGSAAAMAGHEPEEDVLSFPLAAGQYFMLGDNSSASKDSRAWGTPTEPLHHVDRHLIVGRALAIFWPHAIPAKWSVPLRFRGMEVRLPSWPNFGRMGFVR